MKGHNRKKFLAGALFAVSAFVGMPASAADVGVSVTVGQPGFYGRIDIGDFPRPVLVYPEPIIVRPVGVAYEPIYLHVPPGHAKKWRSYCGQYNACGRPVYFVQDHWYNDVYVPEYRERHHGGGSKHSRGDRDHGGRDHGDHGMKHDKGGKGHDRGPGKGNDKH
ncbi:MAG: hypothetical protein ACAH06_01700 [Methylophilaceae bacterium]|uniref:hypothetical protein n=1 Tax=Methylobacillus sp. MM3 TaxID=1848039 RepID=UPI0007E25C28|nr:hypothetical protein [Methylobacillus sp. MM3]OAJ70243.1 hypothetical protein A7976_00985 [Methylobacillus sp. MM3]